MSCKYVCMSHNTEYDTPGACPVCLSHGWSAYIPAESKPALATQVGGSHYKDCAIQPVEFCMANGFDACQSAVVKYITRFRSKNGVQDLEKAKHYIDLLIEFERKKPC